NGVFTDGVQQEVPLYSVFNYGRPITSPNILPTISASEPSRLFPTAGYVNYNDVKMSSYYYSGLATATNASGTIIPINEFYVRDYVWLANYLSDWRVYTPISLGSVVNAKNNLNGTVTITFSQAHNLTRFQEHTYTFQSHEYWQLMYLYPLLLPFQHLTQTISCQHPLGRGAQ
ncbi:MAG: hypothetical protein WCH96_07845, partial [Betaproteobacteria bacterium]